MLRDVITVLGLLAASFVVAASLALLVKFLLKPPRELMRKLLHIICVMSFVVLLRASPSWGAAVISALVFALVVYPALVLCERTRWYQRVLPQRGNGEFKRSLLVAYGMFALLTAVFWGWLGEGWKFVVVVAILAWGYGDAAAALVGKAFGKKRIEHPLVEGQKTVEGTLAMFAVSLVAIFITMMAYTVQPWYLCLALALLVAPVCALVELFTRRGMDTVTVPLAAAVSVFALLSLFSLLGI